MKIDKGKIINNICYTDLVYGRINKKLNTNYSKEQIEKFILEVLNITSSDNFSKVGKNYYITNGASKVLITVNSNTYRVITVDRLKEETP